MDGDALLEWVADLKHDLGKYVAWASANFPADAWTSPTVAPEFADAVRNDLLRTRGGRPAWEVWEERRGTCSQWDRWPSLVEVDRAVSTLRGFAPALRSADDQALADARAAIRDAQEVIRGRLKTFHRELLEAREAASRR